MLLDLWPLLEEQETPSTGGGGHPRHQPVHHRGDGLKVRVLVTARHGPATITRATPVGATITLTGRAGPATVTGARTTIADPDLYAAGWELMVAAEDELLLLMAAHFWDD